MLRVMDLFSGIGGFSLGLHRAGGFRTVAFSEINPYCQAVLRNRFPDVPVFPDVRKLEFDGDVDVITSGDPCQNESRANQGRDGGSLWPFTFIQIRRHRPLFVLRENVSGNIETGSLERVERDLRSAGYIPRSYHIYASALGARHDRPRTWTLAYANHAGLQECDDAAEPSPPEKRQHTLHVGPHGLYWVGTESPVLRRTDDVPHRVDRIAALGNAIIPDIAELFGRAILRSRGKVCV